MPARTHQAQSTLKFSPPDRAYPTSLVSPSDVLIYQWIAPLWIDKKYLYELKVLRRSTADSQSVDKWKIAFAGLLPIRGRSEEKIDARNMRTPTACVVSARNP